MTDDRIRHRVRHGLMTPYLDGVYLAVNALEDSYLVYDAHNCGYYKAEKIAGNHDLRSGLMRWDQLDRVLRTNIESREFIMGSDDRLSKKLRQVVDRYAPRVIFVASSPVMVFTGHDSGPVLREMRAKASVPIVSLPTGNLSGDHLQGYLDAVAGLSALLTWTDEAPEPRRVLLAGYVFERHEGDHRGNVAELKRLARAAGATTVDVLLDGRPAAQALERPRPGLIVDLTERWPAASALADRGGSPLLPAGLPLGLEPTARWVRSLAARLAPDEDVEPLLERELGALARELRWVIPRFLGRPVVVFADRLWLSPLVTLLAELGFDVRAVGCTSPGAEYAGDRVDPGPEPERLPEEIPALRDRLADLRARHEVELVIGNSYLHQLVQPLGLPYVDFGYPCNFHHALREAPTVGFAGVRTWAERLLNALWAPPGAAPARR